MQYLVQFRLGSKSAERRWVYAKAWGLGFCKTLAFTQNDQGLVRVFVVRGGMNAPQQDKLESLLNQSPAVESWRKQEPFPCQ